MGILFSGGGSGFSGSIRSRSSTRGGSSGGVSIKSVLFRAKPKPAPPPPPRPRTAPQPKAPVQTTALRSDQAPEQTKKPIRNLGAEQKVVNAGDTIPIVFGKRANEIGGVWMQPQLSRQSGHYYVGAFLYPISQGEIVSSPEKFNALVGTENIAFRSDADDIALLHFYSTSAALAASPNACPITSGAGPSTNGSTPTTTNDTWLFCDYNIYSDEVVFKPGSGVAQFNADWDVYYWSLSKTVGTGDLTNTVMESLISTEKCFELETGTDKTTEYQAIFSGFTKTVLNGVYVEVGGVFNLVGGRAAGTVVQIQADGTTRAPLTTNFLGGTADLVTVYDNFTVNTQANPSNAATDSTIEAVIDEAHMSPYADPTSPPSSANYQSFADITFLQIRGNIYDPQTTAGVFPRTTRQLKIFYEQGVKVDLYSQAQVGGVYQTGASNQFVDLAMYLFQLLGRVDGATTANIATPIDTSNLLTLASFCTNNGTFFNGIIDQQVNAIEYLSQSAPFFLLRFISSNGRYSLQPILPITSGQAIDVTALTPAATFTDADILPGTYNKTYAEAEERRDIIAQVLWRKTDKKGVGQGATSSVRFSTTSVDAPAEQFDLTDCCTSAAHAQLFAKYQLAFRKHVTHSISFAIPLDTTGLIPTQIIRVQRSRVSSVGDNRTETENYQIEKISHSTAGVTIIEATHFPLTAGNISEISNEIVNGTFTVR